MKRYFLAVLGLFSMVFPTLGAPGPTDSISVDLDGDGRAETIIWPKFKETEEEGAFHQIKVLRPDGTVRWEGTRVADPEHPLTFGDWHYGQSLPQIAADIDGDGAVELVAPVPQGDVSPTWFRVFRWTAAGFLPLKPGALMEKTRGSGHFAWYRGEDYQGTWISGFLRANADGSLRVGVMEYIAEATPRMGEANITAVEGGYRVKDWPVPMKALPDMPSPEPDGSSPTGGVVIYRARLSQADHFNSAGVALKTVGEILRQDRANYHGGKGDDDDGPDPVFRSREGREGMDRRKPVPVGLKEPAWREEILLGTPLVEVEVTPVELRVRIVE